MNLKLQKCLYTFAHAFFGLLDEFDVDDVCDEKSFIYNKTFNYKIDILKK